VPNRWMLVPVVVSALALAGCGGSHPAPDQTLKAPAGVATSAAPSAPVAADVPPVGAGGTGPLTYGGVDVDPAYPSLPLSPVGRREAGPVALRLFTSKLPDQGVCDPYASECVPPWCQPTSLFVLELSTPAIAVREETQVIGVGPGSHMSLLDNVTDGTAEGSPVQIAVVRTADDVGRVELKSASGVDSASPVQGLVALAVPGAGAKGTLTAFDSAGRTLQSLTLPAGQTVNLAECARQAKKLPVPGKPPADPLAAETEVRAAFVKAFTAVPEADAYAGLVAVQNGEQLHGAVDQVRRNFPQAAGSISVTTGKLVFTNPETAVIQYTPTYTGGAPYGAQNGTAVLQDGTWLVSESTFCDLMRFGGATCP
jgi:hypothetical protein